MIDIVLTRLAKATIDDTLEYTADAFGNAQAVAYHDALWNRLASLADGRPPHGRSCNGLVRGLAPEGLLYVREREHFIVFVKTDDCVTVLDFIHQKRDLPTLIAKLKA